MSVTARDVSGSYKQAFLRNNVLSTSEEDRAPPPGVVLPPGDCVARLLPRGLRGAPTPPRACCCPAESRAAVCRVPRGGVCT